MHPSRNAHQNSGPARVSHGLFWAWVVNDLEELVTMGPWSRSNAAELSRRAPIALPDWAKEGLDETHVRVSIAVMGGVMYAFSARGVATGGRSRLYQAALLGFGLHGFTHLTNSMSWRSYTPGVVTAPPVVIPFSALALRRLAKAGVLSLDRTTVGIAAVGPPALMVAIHILTGEALRRLRTRR